MATDYTGMVFGKITVLRPAPMTLHQNQRRSAWIVRCECGREYSMDTVNIGRNKTCKYCSGRKPREHLVGQKFGKWTVLALGPDRQKKANPSKRHKFLTCRCDCGTEREVDEGSVISGRSQTCGCSWSDGGHGKSDNYIYGIWKAIKQRCFNPNCKAYKNYGARGITMCDRWRNSFEAFYADVGDRPTDSHMIERANNDGHYEKGNVIWETRSNQMLNTRRNPKAEEVARIRQWWVDGVPLWAIAKATGRAQETILKRVSDIPRPMGWKPNGSWKCVHPELV